MTIISLVSDQPMPNLLFIRQMPTADRYVFLTTERMEEEGKADNLVRVCGIPSERVDYLFSDHENLPAILAAWEELEEEPDDEYHINLTGGTKMMALATYDFFSRSMPEHQVHLYYLPLNAGLIRQTYPEAVEIPLDIHVSVETYLDVHGVKLLSHELWEPWVPEAKRIHRHISRKQTDKQIQSQLLEARADPINLGIQTLSREERDFFSGKWLEIWLASQVQELLGVPYDQILVGAKVNKSGKSGSTANEYDLLFVRNNRLYLGECKYFTSPKEKKMKDISRELFKMGGANNLTGLNARPFLAIHGGFPSLLPAMEEQCQILRLRPPALTDTLNDEARLALYLHSL